MEMLNTDYGINHFQFSDELFMSSEKRIWHFCEALIHNIDWPNFKWDCNGRLNFAKKETLELMKLSGCEYINYGIICFVAIRNICFFYTYFRPKSKNHI